MIKNLKQLNLTTERINILQILDYGLNQTKASIVLKNSLKLKDNILYIQNNNFNLNNFKKIIIIGIGKSSAESCFFLEKLLKDKITCGFCIDIKKVNLKNINLTIGTHPLVSKTNINFTKKVISLLSRLNKNDLVITIISGGGSALFDIPTINIKNLNSLFRKLTKKGADIYELNTVRKHLSLVKGGNLSKIIHPATSINLIFSDIPGNDMSFIASGPTTKDKSTKKDAENILKKYQIKEKLNFTQNPKDKKYFARSFNFIVCSPKTTLKAMQKMAENLNIKSKILTDNFKSDASEAGKKLLQKTKKKEILFTAGETTVKIKGTGKGGRNQHTVLASLLHLKENELIISCASDGCDYTTNIAGAIGDYQTIKKAKKLNLDINKYLNENNSFTFFKKTKDQIITKKTGFNVSDIFITYKK